MFYDLREVEVMLNDGIVVLLKHSGGQTEGACMGEMFPVDIECGQNNIVIGDTAWIAEEDS
jgi:hypothetical protein